MRIDPSLTASAVSPVSTKIASRTGLRFEPGGRDGPTRTASRRGTVTLTSLSTIIALQSEDEEVERRRRGARRGREILDALDDLKASLLAGRISSAALDRLAAGLADLPISGEPTLDAILTAIELRARVELAKLGRSA